ncbi:uncharacterized protein TNCV_3332591 [Trichonephila clavipes]|nr:uncharacterized protein TNCV_3332591 [Trichonephila clavipes]
MNPNNRLISSHCLQKGSLIVPIPSISCKKIWPLRKAIYNPIAVCAGVLGDACEAPQLGAKPSGAGVNKPPPPLLASQTARVPTPADGDFLLEDVISKECCHVLNEVLIRNIWNKLWPDLEGEKNFYDDRREEITDFVQPIPGFKECDEDVETWTACDAENFGFQMLNDDEIVTSVQEESGPIDDETDEDEDNNNN